jgi:hypothetical protein
LERAFDATWEAIKGDLQRFDADNDEELEAEVRRKLIEIVRINGVTDPETLKDILLASNVDVEKSSVQFVKHRAPDCECYVVQLDPDEVSDMGDINKIEAIKRSFRFCIHVASLALSE